MAHTSPVEIEVKLRVPGPEAARMLLEQHGFEVSVPRLLESNTVYDTPQSSLRTRGELVRIRTVRQPGESSPAADALLTFKGVSVPGRHKVREERETRIADPDVLDRIFERLDLRPAFRYEKYRTEHLRKGGGGTVTIDETPIGTFLEIEGPPDWIDGLAAELGFTENDYVLSSYGALYFEHCQTHSIKPGNMVFKND